MVGGRWYIVRGFFFTVILRGFVGKEGGRGCVNFYVSVSDK